MVAVGKAREKAQVSRFRTEVGEFVKALEIYRTSHGYYPKCQPDGNECVYYQDGTGSWQDTFSSQYSTGGVPILTQLKNDKILQKSFIEDIPNSKVNFTAAYLDVSMIDYGLEFTNIDSLLNPDNYLFDWWNVSLNNKFSGKNFNQLKEYAFCIFLKNTDGTSVDLGSETLTKNPKGAGYFSLDYTSYCSGN